MLASSLLPHRRSLPGGRAFHLLLCSLAVSSCGDWLYNVALLAFVYERTHSATWLAVTTTARIAPIVALGPFGGVMADRHDRRALMIASDLIRAALMLALAGAAAAGLPIVLAPILASAATAAATVQPPSMAACTARLVPDSELQRAQALRAAIGQGAIVVGPALGALVLALTNPALAILLNALTFLASAIAVAETRPGPAFAPPREMTHRAVGMRAEIATGARALRHAPAAVRLITADVLCSAVYGLLTVALVLLSRRLGAGNGGYGLLLGAYGIGGVIGAAATARASDPSRWRAALIIALFLVATTLMVLGAVSTLTEALVASLLGGGGMVVGEVLSETALPRMVGEDVLARAYGLALPASLGGIVAGSLIAGPLVALVGLSGAFVLSGLLVAIACAILARRPLIPDRMTGCAKAAPRRRVAGGAGRVISARRARPAVRATIVVLVVGAAFTFVSGAGAHVIWGNQFASALGAAGTGNGGFQLPFAAAVDPADGSVYVVDSAANRVQHLAADGAYLSQFGGTGAGDGEFDAPEGVAVDPADGDVYVADTGNGRVEKFNSSGVYQSKFSTPGAFGSPQVGPSAIAVDPSTSDVYVTDTGSDSVEEFDSAGALLRQFGAFGFGAGQFDNPVGVAFDVADQSVLVADTDGQRIEKFSAAGAFEAQFAGSGSGSGSVDIPVGIAVDPSDGSVYVADSGNHRVVRFSADGTYESQFGAEGSAGGQFAKPFGVAVSPIDGDVYVTDPDHQRVERFGPGGMVLLTFGGAGTADGQFHGPEGIAVDPADGNVYVSDEGNSRVEKLTANGVFVSQFGSAGSGNGQFSDVFGVAVDPSTGDVYAVDANNDRVEKFAPSGGYLSQFGSAGSNDGQLDSPQGIAVSPADGSVYVTDTGNDRVEEFSSAGAYVSQFGSAGQGAGQFSDPTAVAVDPSTGAVYVADASNDQVEKFTSGGAYVSEFGSPGSGPGQLSLPDGIAVDGADGSISVADVGNDRVETFSSAGGYQSQFAISAAPSGLDFSSIALDQSDGSLYLTDVSAQTITRFGVPPAPSCDATSRSTGPATPVTISLSCHPATGDRPFYQLESAPSHGALSGFDPYAGTVLYTPDRGYTGPDSFAFRGTGDGGSTTATVSLVINPSPPATGMVPTAVPITVTPAGAGHPSAAAVAGRPSASHLSLTGIAKHEVRLRLTLAAGRGAPELTRITITLPARLSFVKRTLAQGLTVTTATGRVRHFSDQAAGRTLSVSLKAPTAKLSIVIGDGAVTATRAEVAAVVKKRIRTVTVVVAARDARGTTTRLTTRTGVA
jgi:tripartite motif-containing protein 71